jgi:hypothetical protein
MATGGAPAAGGIAPESRERSDLNEREAGRANRHLAMATRGLPGEPSPAHSSIFGGLGGSAPRLTLSKLLPLKLR